VIDSLKVPRPVIGALGMPAAESSQVSWMRDCAAKPEPRTIETVPAGPTAGVIVIVAVGVVAMLAVNGSTRAAASMTIVAVAMRSRQPVPPLFGMGEASETHRVPSQKANVVLHSATRLTQ
jgi:hypothetical protein